MINNYKIYIKLFLLYQNYLTIMTYTLNIAQSIDQNRYLISGQLIQLVSGVYSDNWEKSYDSFYALVNYFESGCATAAERQFLVTENNNFIERLISDLRRDNLEKSQLLSNAVGQVVAAAAPENQNNYDLEHYLDNSDSESSEGEIDIMNDDPVSVEEEIDIMGDYSETDA